MRCADHALEYRKLADIKPYQKNPRKNDKAVTAVANSIREYGFQSPIIVDRDGVIIAGHTRYKAAKRLRLSTVPVIVAAELTPEQGQRAAYRRQQHQRSGRVGSAGAVCRAGTADL